MNALAQKIHDIVHEEIHPVNPNQIFQILKDRGEDVTIEEVRTEIGNLVRSGFLKDANLPSYYPLH